MVVNPTAVGVVAGLSGVALEYVIARATGRASLYRFSTTVANLACAFGSEAVGMLLGGFTLLLYTDLYEHYALLTLPAVVAWPLGILLMDCLYYWSHRLSHEWSFLWASHGVHHHSEDFNLTVSAREPYFTLFMLAPFFVPLAFLGVPPVVYLVGVAVHVLFGFLEHTVLVGRLWAPLEYLFATPSNHRVHHATNPEYMDRNYGGFLIIWDRLFGTYEPERAKPVFGVTRPPTTLNPVVANFEHWGRMIRAAGEANGLRAKVRVFFGPPSALPKGPGELKKLELPETSRGLRIWVAVQLAGLAVFLVTLMQREHGAPLAQRLLGPALVLASSVSLTALLERKRYAWPLEVTRLVGVAGMTFMML